MKNSGGSHHTRREFLFRSAAAAAAVSAIPSVLTSCAGGKHDFDYIIKGGTVYNGTGARPVVTDIGIKKGRITAIGKIEGSASTVIDAAGRTVAPGFIDVHTHCDLTFKRTGVKRHLSRVLPSWKGNYNYLYQGVTTVVTGNCGYGYTDTEKWLSMVNGVGFGSNVVHLVPHGMIREELFGDNQPGKLTRSQLDKMISRVEEEMDKGAVGMSTGLAYVPGLLTDTSEIITLARVVAKKGGLYASHIRNESGIGSKNGKPAVVNALDEAIRIGEEAGLPVQVSHLKISVPMGRAVPEMLMERIERARTEGLDVTADQYPYAAGSTHIAILLPVEFVSSSGVKEKYWTEEGNRTIQKAILQVFEYLPPEKILITMFPEREEFEGKTLKEAAEIMDLPPQKAYGKMVARKEAPVGVFFSQDMDVVRSIMPSDYVFTASDGWTVPKGMTHPHPRCYGTFPRKLGRFVREEKVMNLSRAIRSMTSLPAEKFSIRERGVLAPGNYADIVIVDTKKVIDRATYENPHQYATGIDYVFVNGTMAMEKGEATEDRGGISLVRS